MVCRKYEFRYYRRLNVLEKIKHPHDKSEELTKYSHYHLLKNSILFPYAFH